MRRSFAPDQVDAQSTVKALGDSSRTSQYPSCSVEARDVDKLEKTRTGTPAGGRTETNAQLRSPAERGFSQGKAGLDGEAGLGLEHGNVGTWEHNDEGGGDHAAVFFSVLLFLSKLLTLL